MTRPKVDPDKRQRTAQACDSCKRRKQKCNGLRPCNTCTKRQLDCQYTPSSSDISGPQDSPPTKRRHVDGPLNLLRPSIQIGPDNSRNNALMPWNHLTEPGDMNVGRTIVIKHEHKQAEAVRPLLGDTEGDCDSRSKLSNASIAAEEAEVYPQNRMLQDSTGRLLYIGDSATLSYLQWIRMIVENISGRSEFTTDPRRHMIMENTISLSQSSRPTGVLPDQRTANVLITSFFTNTAGFIEVFNKHSFLKSVEECYKDPLGSPPSLLCLLYLVFAIGLTMAAPFPGSDEAAIIDKLRSDRANHAELFFRSAKNLADPVSGFEDADFWSIQALLLMSLYMLSISKRNASYAYYGMAVRSAFALGLHRVESLELFQPEECLVRKNLWRTLFILDRFLSACLGRPTAISEDDCSRNTFEAQRTAASSPMSMCTEATHLVALEAAVKTCRVIGMTLKRVYSKRKISTAAGQELASDLGAWNRELTPCLHWRRLININDSIDPAQGIAILHVNLLHCHSVMLLTRPYFLWLINKSAAGLSANSSKLSRLTHRMENFAQTCVEASQHILVLTQAVLDNNYLPQCNPFVIHCVFAAALIVLSNEFALLYHNPDARKSIDSAISILRFCSQNDKQAERVSYIVESFDKANEQRTAKRPYLPGRKTPVLPTLSQNINFDPIGHFFRSGHRETIAVTTSSAYGPGETVLIATDPSSITAMPIIPSAMQQPSPEGSVSMNSGITGAGMAQGVDVLSGGDSEFDLDTLWDYWHTGPNMQPAVHHQHPGAFYSDVLGHPQVHPGGPSVMYHPSDFR
ncbi:fungal-specific transcription factor domain-containing protein [Nemania sp. FL0916]|nr:fungal-specific transcription factor domain-containing protein [Nemania sp. FL0916]